MKIGLIDHMGYGNLGDAATQDAIMQNIKLRIPDVDFVGFSLNPEDTKSRHNIPCYSIKWWHPGLGSETGDSQRASKWSRLKSTLKQVPVLSAFQYVSHFLHEVRHWWQSFRIIRSLDSLVFAGGGQLGELWRGPWEHPYNVFKFSVLAKLAGKELVFLNVGAGPLRSRLGKFFVRSAVGMADYASFRDIESKNLIRTIGVTRETHVSHDAVYALEISRFELSSSPRNGKYLVGLNPIGFCDPRIWPRQNAAVYADYLNKLSEFCLWLLEHNYRLRVFSAELSVDVHAIEDLRSRLLEKLPLAEVEKIFLPLSKTVPSLVNEMAGFDFVVTSKFHGVVFSHLLEKPVLALSYHNKINDLMKAAGHSEYCFDIADVQLDALKRSFAALVEDAGRLKPRFRVVAQSRRNALIDQFDEVFEPAVVMNHEMLETSSVGNH